MPVVFKEITAKMSAKNPLELPRLQHSDITSVLKDLREVVERVFVKQGRLDIALRDTFKEKVFTEKQRGLLAECAYSLFKCWELLSIGLQGQQLDSALAVGFWFILSGGTLHSSQRKDFTPDHLDQAIKRVEDYLEKNKTGAFYPGWFNDLCIQELGNEAWQEIAKAQLTEPKVYIRTNTLKITRENLKDALRKEMINASIIAENDIALEVARNSRVFKTKAFADGFFEMQDVGSQMVSTFLLAKPKDRIIDACAGEGGKTLHIAAMMENTGRLIAMDIHSYKLDELKRRARRAGAWNIQTVVIEAKTIKKHTATADAILIDAPCSGSGVLRRNPDALLFRKSTFIHDVLQIQQELLHTFHKTVKPGGCLVYCTCSILPSEGEKQILAFLASENGAHWYLEEERRICPAKDGFDGFYIARLRKKLDSSS